MDLAPAAGEDPVVYEPVLGQWFVFGYDEVRAALADDKRLTNDRMHGFEDRAPPDAVDAIRRHAPWVLSAEGADYDWVRWVLHAGLRGATGEASERAVASAAHELLDDLVERDGFDVATDYAFPLTARILADFLGVDRRDGDRLVGWALDLVDFFNDPEITAERTERMARSAAEMIAYAHALMTEHPGQLRSGFLELVARSAAGRGRELDDDTVGNFTLPFLTGEIGVTHLIANTVWLLLEHDDQRARVAADPSLVAGAIAETLRYAPPVLLIPRIALEPVELGGHVVRPGEVVRLSVGAANRDPSRFPEPDRFDVTRPQAGALGFGHGAHSCIGAGVTRLQTPIAVEALLGWASEIELDGEPVWSAVPGVQGIEGLGVRRRAARAARRAR
jgi:cytochrome P450